MERKTPSQLELFSENAPVDVPQERISGSFADYIRAYEKIVLFVIGFVVVGIVSFCFGVEHGKQVALAKLSARFDVAAAPSAQDSQRTRVVVSPAVRPLPAQQAPVQAPVQQQVSDQSGYTIQVASFKNPASAVQETSTLKKKGFPAAAVSKGEYTVVCVGKFTNKEMALPLLSQLRQKYRGCYVRRL